MYAAISCSDKTIGVFDFESGECEAFMQGHSGEWNQGFLFFIFIFFVILGPAPLSLTREKTFLDSLENRKHNNAYKRLGFLILVQLTNSNKILFELQRDSI